MNNIKKRLKDVEERIKANEMPKVMVYLNDGTELQFNCDDVINYIKCNKDNIKFIETGDDFMNLVYNALIRKRVE